MKLTKQSYRNAAPLLVSTVNERHPPLSKRGQVVQYTRSPAGAWVETWVWVPREYALLNKKPNEET